MGIVDGDGYIKCFKARLVAQGFTQMKGAEYAPVVRMESLRTVIGLAIQKRLKIHQLDVTTAFLNGKLQEEIYMKQPEGLLPRVESTLFADLNGRTETVFKMLECNSIDHYLKELGFL